MKLKNALISKVAMLHECNVSQDVKERLAGTHSFEDMESSDKIYSVQNIKLNILQNGDDDTNETVKNELSDIVDWCNENQIDYICFDNDYL